MKHTFFLYRDGFDGHILRFSARLLVNDKPDTQRKFVIAYFLSDDTVLVSQEREQNSGTILWPVFQIEIKNSIIDFKTFKIVSIY